MRAPPETILSILPATCSTVPDIFPTALMAFLTSRVDVSPACLAMPPACLADFIALLLASTLASRDTHAAPATSPANIIIA